MSKTININAESIKNALESSKPTSLTGLWKALGGSGSVSGSASKLMRKVWPGIEEILAENKAVIPLKSERCQKDDGSTYQTSGKFKKPSNSPAKTEIPRHPKNPFRHSQTGYGLLVDLIANAGSNGIGKEALLAQYCEISGKDLRHAKFDLAVINSGVAGGTRHRSMRDGVTVIKDVDNYRIIFD